MGETPGSGAGCYQTGMTDLAAPRAPALRDLPGRAPVRAHGCAVSVLAGVALYGGFQARSWLLPASGISVCVAAMVLALIALARRPGARPFERVFVPIALLPAAAAIALAARLEVEWPVVYLEAFGNWGIEVIGMVVWGVPGLAFAGALLGGVVARRLTAAHARLLRGLAWAAVLASVAFLVDGARRGDTAEGYLARLPVIGTIPAPPTGTEAGWIDHRHARRARPGPPGAPRLRAGLRRDRGHAARGRRPDAALSSPPCSISSPRGGRAGARRGPPRRLRGWGAACPRGGRRS
jgi:hypothetical protein